MHWLEQHPTAPGLPACAGAVGAGWLQLSSSPSSTETEMRQESYGKRWRKQRDGGDLESTNWGKDGQERGKKCSEKRKVRKSHREGTGVTNSVIQTEAV